MKRALANYKMNLDAELLEQVIEKSSQVAGVLVIDREAGTRDYYKGLLSKIDLVCKTAKDGSEALKDLEKETFDIVLADSNVLEMEGLELLRRIKSDHQDVDVIVTTSMNSGNAFVDLIDAGASDFIGKPIRQAELIAKIKRVIRERVIKKELLFLSQHDSLTGLFNRRYFFQKLTEEANRAQRQMRELSCIVIDVDHFKEYNDTHGHLEGDNLLSALGRILFHNLRKKVDIPARVGGDEFAILIIEADQSQAGQIAERIRASFEARGVTKCTLSIGTAQLLPFEEGENLIRRADEAMFVAKKTGGNRVEKSPSTYTSVETGEDK